MPRLPARACAHPGCTNLVRGRRRRFCNDHQSEEWRRQDRDRGTASERGYGDAWTAIRDAFLAEHPRCAQCGSGAEIVHHIVRKRDGGGDDANNLLALCRSCHAKEHGAQPGN